MVDGVYWLSLHVQLQYVIAHTKAAFPLPLYSPFSLFARCCSNRTIAERVVGSFVRVTDIYSSHIEWVGSAILQQEKLYIYREKEGEREASVASNWFNSTAIASVSRVGDYGYNRSTNVMRVIRFLHWQISSLFFCLFHSASCYEFISGKDLLHDSWYHNSWIILKNLNRQRRQSKWMNVVGPEQNSTD